jgi:hypothetical protein
LFCCGVEEAGAPQIPALLFSLASWPMVGPVVSAFVFLMLELALPQIAPNASPPAPAGFVAPGLVTGLVFAMVVGPVLLEEKLDMEDMPAIGLEAVPLGWAETPPK